MPASIDPLERSIDFINPRRLRTNIVLTLRHIIVLIVDAERVNPSARDAYYKSIILFAGAIVEAMAHLILKQYLGSTKKLPLGDWQYSHAQVIRSINSNNQIVWCRRKKAIQKLSKQTTFMLVNKLCKDLSVLNLAQFNHCEKIRDMRNKIHLMGLKGIDKNYTKNDAEYALKVAVELVDLYKSRLPVPSGTSSN